MKKKMWKRWISVFLITLMLFSSVNVVFAKEDNTWKDIQRYYPFSSWASDVGTKYKIIFLENNRRGATRAEVANLLFNLTSIEGQQYSENVFTDISTVTDVLKKRIQKMSNAGIISGYNDGTFKPTTAVTRAEFATMLCRTDLLRGKKTAVSVNFEDISNHWAEKDINKIASLGIVSGKGNNVFCPEDSITLQELVVILDRLVNIDSISKEELTFTIFDTFKSKQYTDKEQYVVEIMYNEFDEIDGFMKYNFPYKEYYDYTNWQDLATAEDIQHVIYFVMSRKAKIQNDEEKSIFNDIGNIVSQNNKLGNGQYTIRDMLYIINQSEAPCQTARWLPYSFYDNVELCYTNNSDIIEADREQLTKILKRKQNKIFDNVAMSFPIDAPITKYMLNYFAMKIEALYGGYREAWDISLKKYCGLEEKEVFVTTESELPSNYADFPYIIKGVPKEIYEKHYVKENTSAVRKPIECHAKYSNAMVGAASWISSFYDVILNVDYRNLNEQNIIFTLSNSFYYVSDEEIYKYINYIKENEIVLKGTGFAVPGTVYISDGVVYIRTFLQFEVVSAKEMKNLLFGDMVFGLPEDITYNAKEYTLCSDLSVQGGPIFWDGELRFDIYKLRYEPILFGIHWDAFTPVKYSLPQ